MNKSYDPELQEFHAVVNHAAWQHRLFDALIRARQSRDPSATPLDETHFESELHMLRESVERYDHERARQIAIGLVPEYREGEESSTAESPNQAA